VASEAERRQLTVLFCDLVGSTQLSAQLDPEDYRAVVQEYQQTCAQVIQRHEGYLAQYLGDGLLVYFGYPVAHEDDARRAVRTGLEIVEAMRGEAGRHPLSVRIGIHTGLVVVGEIGAGGRTEQLALGETPNIAARLQGLAEPNTVLVSAATQRLIEGQFEGQPFGSHLLKGFATPIAVYQVQNERQSASPLAGKATLTPLVGREQEVGLLLDRWEQVKEGRGQVVLLSGEPGIGKSRLAYTLREHVTGEGSLLFETRCSPYHQQSALYPLIDSLQRTFLLTRQDTNDEKVEKVERALTLYNLREAVPLFTALLSLPTPAQYPPLTLTPQKQKERTLQALLQVTMAQAERQATASVWEDLHWADPSSLEFLSLLIEQIPTTKLLLVLTFRPEFTPPWKLRSHLTQLMLNRLGKRQVEAMIKRVAANQELPAEVIDQIRAKTDGVPLFVEELTKNVLESVESFGSPHHTPRQLAIPATLQEALLARLDRLSAARQVAQLGATVGREFSYQLFQAVTPLSEPELRAALVKLVEAEILYQRGVGQQTRYFFKHALIQDTAYQSLLKSTRQQYHRQIAQVLEGRFPDTTETQPELVAHHYTEAGLMAQAIPYWHQAGQRALQRSAHVEAVAHFTTGLELLKTVPETPERIRHELTLQTALSSALVVTKGLGAPEVRKAYDDARELCQRAGETPRLGPVLYGLSAYYIQQEEMRVASELAGQCLAMAEKQHDSSFIVAACRLLVSTSFWSGNPRLAHEYCERGMARYDPFQHRSLALVYGFDPGVSCLSVGAWALWYLGYPEQALRRSQASIALAQEVNHPYTLASALNIASWTRCYRREGQAALTLAEESLALSTAQDFPHWLAVGLYMRGLALIELGQWEEGTAQLRQGLEAYRATGAVLNVRGHGRAELARGYGCQGRIEEGLRMITEALAGLNQVRHYEAEMYRLKGELLLQRDNLREAEACFLKAIEIARHQQAKSWELRAVMSLARLWQQQGKTAEARQLLAEIYGWFTEGFDTKDLQEAKALLEELH
jgi:class 3 adenylate cyclase/predicted ATPase